MTGLPPSERLLFWYDAGHRDLPWRRTRDPYRIWLSEIMLQQTRAAAAIPFYESFLDRFATMEALARASESEVLAAWSGLGYYTRARNLRASAQRMVKQGGFPPDFEGIRALPGVGPYTAAAVASIALGLPHAVLDGNVMRVIARLTNDAGNIGALTTRKRLQKVADAWLDPARPGAFNQAMMELGATVCVPRAPQCLVCPLNNFCEARQAGTQNQLPIKLRKAKPKPVEARVLIALRNGRILLRQRAENSSRMAGFWELPALEDVPGLRETTLLGKLHHTIVNQCYSISVYSGMPPFGRVLKDAKWIEQQCLKDIPITTITRKALKLLPDR